MEIITFVKIDLNYAISDNKQAFYIVFNHLLT